MSPAAVLERFQTELFLTENGRAAWERIFSCDLSQVRAKVLKEQTVPEDLIDAAIREYRRFLALRLLGFQGLGMVSREVDEVWHTHILFTRDYVPFCEDVFGGYLHHQPATDAEPIAANAGERFVEAYREVFGDLDPVWTVHMAGADGGIRCGSCTPPPAAT